MQETVKRIVVKAAECLILPAKMKQTLLCFKQIILRSDKLIITDLIQAGHYFFRKRKTQFTEIGSPDIGADTVLHDAMLFADLS
jgi:hypothetical protein